ncbi:MAG: GNAT family N-acetyltransferase [Alphaproteobacteria bacterium]|nr:GNAT family N-acetyltransferase [Alphaproteobacteria bacterium]
MTNTNILETKRLILRPWQAEDAEDLYRYAKNPLIGPAAGWKPHFSVNNSRQIILDYLSVAETYAVVLKNVQHPVGSISLKNGKQSTLVKAADEAEIGYWIAQPFWGQGLMSEAVEKIMQHAFADLKFQKLWGGYYDGNDRSRRVLQKCGMVYEYSQKKYVTALDEERIEHIFSLTKDKWITAKRG